MNNFQRQLDETAARWEREEVTAIALAISRGRVADVRYYETQTGKGLAVEVTTTSMMPSSITRDEGRPYRHACLVENYDAARRCNPGIPVLPGRKPYTKPACREADFEDRIDWLCAANPHM